MRIEDLRVFLLWCTVLDYALLILWFLLFWLAHDAMRRIHALWFRLSEDRFDENHYQAMALFKIGILLFNLVPCVATWLVS